jgi:hypothetical protein
MVPLSRQRLIINLEVSAMERIRLIIAGISLALLLLGAVVWADTITITDATGPDLTYQSSPNVEMSYEDVNATADRFCITSLNKKGTMEYGIVSDFSGYYQHTVDVGANVTSADGAEATIEGWTQMTF